MPTVEIRADDIDPVMEARFWQFVEIDFKPGACWRWKSTNKTGAGYGRFKMGNRKISANRISYALFNRVTPKGMFVCHRCDNPECVRPDHLFLGTAADNAYDRGIKKRNAFGEKSGTAILKEKEVLEIDALIDLRIPERAIAAQFGISRRSIQKIKYRENWKHILPPR